MNLKYIYTFTFLLNCIFTYDYVWPTNASETITACFGEMRTNRYHAGIDIRTYGINGREIYSISDGYVYRIKVSNDGYGNVLYIKLNDKNIALYAHLSKFNKKIQKIVHQIQTMRDSYSIDHLIEPGLINVKKGEIIGYTGDTGGLSGPHLHFEIRDEINRPINPLKTNLIDYLTDNKNPIPKTIAITPQSINTKIDGNIFMKEYEAHMIDFNNYIIKDTINIEGEFGISVKVFDKIDLQPFNFGIYSIELFIDSLYHYGIKFDKTSFEQSNQMYLERDYNLLSKNKGEFYQLFKPKHQNNYFVDKKSKNSILKDSGIHQFHIKITDIKKNQSNLYGNFIIRSPEKNDYTYYATKKNNSWKIDFNNVNKISTIELYLQNRTNFNNTKINPEFEILNDNSIIINNVKNPYNVLYFQLSTLKGPLQEEYILLGSPSKNIDGYFSIDHNTEGISATYFENNFSGKTPNLVYTVNNKVYKSNMYRKDKNLLSSKRFSIKEFLKMNEIRIEYEDDLLLSKKTLIDKMVTYPNIYTKKTFQNGLITITHNKETFFDTTLIYITTPPIYMETSESLIAPFYIGPNSIPFNKPLEFSINIYDQDSTDNLVISTYDIANKKWLPLATRRTKKSLISNIQKGSIIGIFKDSKDPDIKNIIPRNGATYLKDDLNNFDIIVEDNFSGVNHKDGIHFTLNGQKIITGFNLYQNKIITNVKGHVKKGKNDYELIIYDNANNSNQIKGHFFIK
ncbi:MAG: hypothetical protein CMG00_02125 [Candidatus Marinimicrobia bacterium]|nr:hypothetical protein [Candidatus Neomarinimicrobiota bacterium]